MIAYAYADVPKKLPQWKVFRILFITLYWSTRSEIDFLESKMCPHR